MPQSASTLKADTWKTLLAKDPDKDYIMQGIENGFDIVNNGLPDDPVEVQNYSSALNSKDLVEDQIKQEISEGRYIIVHEKPKVISALGAIPKPDGRIRLIHDCSRPHGKAVNDYAKIKSHIKYQSVKDAVQLITPGCWLAKIDLQNAYRSVRTNPHHWQFAGLQWKFKGDSKSTFLIDTRLPFGARLSVESFHRISKAIQRILAKAGIKTVIYLDDILIVSDTKANGIYLIQNAIRILRSLGFAISYKKVEGPSQTLTFLGIQINTTQCTLSLPGDKMQQCMVLLQSFTKQRRASLKQLQRLIGKLAWASHVVNGGRTFLQRVLDTARPIKEPTHKVKLTPQFYLDIQWWLTYMPIFNVRHFNKPPRPPNIITTDSSSLAGGATLNDQDWMYLDWIIDYPSMKDQHINFKEVMTACAAIYRWAPQLQNSSVTLYTDNIYTRATINKGACSDPLVMFHLRQLFWLANIFNFELKCVFIPGKDNIASDCISRLRSGGNFLYWFSLITGIAFDVHLMEMVLSSHMSHACICFFKTQIQRLVPWLRA